MRERGSDTHTFADAAVKVGRVRKQIHFEKSGERFTKAIRGQAERKKFLSLHFPSFPAGRPTGGS